MQFINLSQVEDKVKKGVKWKKYNLGLQGDPTSPF